MRLSTNNFAGTARTLVAVGTESEASIDCTTRPATPRKGSTRAELGAATTGAGLTCGSAGVGIGLLRLFKTGCATGCAGAAGVGELITGVTGATTGFGAAAFGVGGTPPLGAPAIGLPTCVDTGVAGAITAETIPCLRKYSTQAGSTELGSF